MSTYDPLDDDAAPTIAAIFSDRASAHEALGELHRAGFRKVWLGVTRADTATGEGAQIEPDGGGFMEALGRFFSGDEAREHGLHEALVAHGLGERQARRIDAAISPGNAVVLVNGEYDPAQAMRVLRAGGGELETNAGAAASGDDPERRLELREERLTVDKERVLTGEARIGKTVISEDRTLDVPVFHEELYIERRPVSGARAETGTAIGDDADIRVPLTAERVDVAKRTVVAEEVVVGKRRVDGTERVDETVRREELQLDPPANESLNNRADATLGDRKR